VLAWTLRGWMLAAVLSWVEAKAPFVPDSEDPEHCFEVSKQPVKDGKSEHGKSVIRSGIPLNDSQSLAVYYAIEILANWEEIYDLSPFDGNRKSSSLLEELLTRDRICVEDTAKSKEVAATTLAEDYSVTIDGTKHVGIGAPGIHVSKDFLPEEGESLTEFNLFRLALVLWHESGHLQDKRRWPGDRLIPENEREVPVYGWIITEAGKIIRSPHASQTLKNALREAIVTAADFCMDQPPVGHVEVKARPLGLTMPGAIVALEPGSKGRYLFAMDAAGHVQVLDAKEQKGGWVNQWPGATSLAVGGDFVYVVGKDLGLIRVSARKGSKSRELQLGDIGVYVVEAGSPVDESALSLTALMNGRRVCVAFEGGQLSLVDALEHRKCQTIDIGKKGVFSLAVDPKEKSLAVGCGDGDICLVHPTKGKELELGPLIGHKTAVEVLEYSRSGDHLVSGSRDGQLFVWDLDSEDPPRMPFFEHEAPIESIAIDPNSRWMASCDANGVLICWELHTARVIHKLDGVGPAIAFVTDGDHLIFSRGKSASFLDIAGLEGH